MTYNRSKVLISSITSAILKERAYFKIGENYEGSGTTVTSPPTFPSGGYTYYVPEGDYTNNNLVLGNISIGGNLPITNIVTTGSPLFNSRYVISSTGEVKVIGSLDYDYVGGRSLSASLAISNSLGTNNVNITINVTDIPVPIIASGQSFIYDLFSSSNTIRPLSFTSEVDIVSSSISPDPGYTLKPSINIQGEIDLYNLGLSENGLGQYTNRERIFRLDYSSPDGHEIILDSLLHNATVLLTTEPGLGGVGGSDTVSETIQLDTIYSGNLIISRDNIPNINNNFPIISHGMVTGTELFVVPVCNDISKDRTLTYRPPNMSIQYDDFTIYNNRLAKPEIRFINYSSNGIISISETVDIRFFETAYKPNYAITTPGCIPVHLNTSNINGNILVSTRYHSQPVSSSFDTYHEWYILDVPYERNHFLEICTMPGFEYPSPGYYVRGNFDMTYLNIDSDGIITVPSYPLGLGTLIISNWDTSTQPWIYVVRQESSSVAGSYILQVKMSKINPSDPDPFISFNFSYIIDGSPWDPNGSTLSLGSASFTGEGYKYVSIDFPSEVTGVEISFGNGGVILEHMSLRKKTANWFD